ncbi:MAG: 1-acyl-sn-glycerol-3-phosphate acyltransferase [Dictyoglomus thermophilum]|nr:lysophospholipid acyltransferase family protein [Dictyoglomus thermophilum]MCX7721026.1 1-acyl-sn-glycerol-3-phosphate acyltransferase [Dictyoglomus thermophilum]
MKRRKYSTSFQPLLYKGIANIIRIFLKKLYKLEVKGIENIPLYGPVIIAPNHRSSLDVLAIAVSLPRPIKALGKIERFKYSLLGRFARFLGGIPVNREHVDLSAVKGGIEALKRGEVLLVFPEGTRLRTEKKEVKPKRGIGYFAAKMKVPVIPAAIVGADHIWPPEKKVPSLRGKIKVIFLQPVYYEGEPDRDKEEEFTNNIMKQIEAVLRRESLNYEEN